MRIFVKITGVLIVIAAAGSFQGAVIAQQSSSTQPTDETLADTFERTFFKNDPNFFRNRSLGRQLNWMFGVNGFVENEINQDAAELHDLLRTSLKRQNSSDRVIRTRDLPNPFNSSILSSPKSEVNQDAQSNDVIFEK